MASFAGIGGRLRAWWALPGEVAELRRTVDETHHLLARLNHEVHAGAETALPLFTGYTERLRLDTDTAIGAAQVIERQLAELEHMLAALRRDG